MPDSDTDNLTIIGIGSSAGGLEAIRSLVAALPPDAPVSYVVVQHMSPHHDSLMTALVSRDTKLEVRDVRDGIKPERNVIYITPPKADVLYEKGRLRLVDPSTEVASPKPSVDRFLTSLAQEHGDKAMGIILSGTGSDGAYGIQAIREHGGITIVQDVESAKYDGMPQSAVQTGCVDLVLSPPEIGSHLTKILNAARDFKEFRSTNLPDTPTSDLLQILLAHTRVDFRDYKQTTIGRRIRRRMVALNIESEEEYTEFCRHNPSAVDALFKDLLISVTRFFRDKEAFDQLKAILPKLVERQGSTQLRVWVAGCATGEEVYSIAMALCEALECIPAEFKSKVQIFATDIDNAALRVARQGQYNLSALNDIPKALADKYLVRSADSVRVIEPLRSAILFSNHNVCQDPPFQRVDLLCCRNLLIYFGHALQRKVLGRFHYAMRPDALLFLGTAESVAGSDELFVQHREAAHVFEKRNIRSAGAANFSMPNMAPMRANRAATIVDHGPSTDRQLLQALAQSLGDNSILVTDEYSIAQVFGDVSAYISVNNASNLRMHVDLLRSPLREEARSLVAIALKSGKRRSGVRHLLADGNSDRLRLDVYPMIASEISEKAALIVFTPLEAEEPLTLSNTQEANGATARDERISILENEVATTREALQQTIEELETSNEELQSLNEELQSTNEELQATNEELETSNEELQSTNEELITVNEELQVTTTELTERSAELESVLSSAPLVIMVTDTALQVTQATLEAVEMFGLSSPASGPHISQCVLPDGFPALSHLCSETMQRGEKTVRDFVSNGAQVTLICSPSFNTNGKVSGVTLVVSTFPGLADEMDTLLKTEGIYVMQRSKQGEILRVSNAFAKFLHARPGALIGKKLAEFIDEAETDEISADDRAFLSSGMAHATELRRMQSHDGQEIKWLAKQKYPLWNDKLEDQTIYTVATDVTEVVRARNAAEAATSQIELLQDVAGIGYWSIDVLEGTVGWSREVHRIHRTDPETFVPTLEMGLSFYHPDDVDEVTSIVEKALENGEAFEFRKRIIAADKTVVEIESNGMAIQDPEGHTVRIVGVFREI